MGINCFNFSRVLKGEMLDPLPLDPERLEDKVTINKMFEFGMDFYSKMNSIVVLCVTLQSPKVSEKLGSLLDL